MRAAGRGGARSHTRIADDQAPWLFMPEGGEVTYQSYLRLPDLLALQRPLSDPEHPEEPHFIIVHQITELWFKLVLHHLERVICCIDAADAMGAAVLMRRINHALSICVEHVRSLQDMPPSSFRAFRGGLGAASGLHSVQFRELELLSGLRTPEHLALLERLAGGSLPAAVAARLRQRSLPAAHRDAARALGIGDWAGFYAEPGEHAAFYVLCELLVDYDMWWTRWRQEHVILVERMIGARTRGTAGTSAVSLLERTATHRYFPYLWEARNELSLRGGGESQR
jgi:tryptophan 2,3-dioxygenase